MSDNDKPLPDWDQMANPNVDNITIGSVIDQVLETNMEEEVDLETPRRIVVRCKGGCHDISFDIQIVGAKPTNQGTVH